MIIEEFHPTTNPTAFTWRHGISYCLARSLSGNTWNHICLSILYDTVHIYIYISTWYIFIYVYTYKWIHSCFLLPKYIFVFLEARNYMTSGFMSLHTRTQRRICIIWIRKQVWLAFVTTKECKHRSCNVYLFLWLTISDMNWGMRW